MSHSLGNHAADALYPRALATAHDRTLTLNEQQCVSDKKQKHDKEAHANENRIVGR
jgi:hypothetical protein